MNNIIKDNAMILEGLTPEDIHEAKAIKDAYDLLPQAFAEHLRNLYKEETEIKAEISADYSHYCYIWKEEAYRIRTEKCTSNGLDFYIEKYGKEKGTEKFNNRLKYWKHKIYTGNHHSKIADKFFLKLSELYDKKDNIYFGNHEYMLTYDGKVILPDFLDVDNKKII